MNNCEIAPCIVINVHVPKRNLGRKDFFLPFLYISENSTNGIH